MTVQVVSKFILADTQNEVVYSQAERGVFTQINNRKKWIGSVMGSFFLPVTVLISLWFITNEIFVSLSILNFCYKTCCYGNSKFKKKNECRG